MISKTSGSKDANTSSASENLMDDPKAENDEARSGLAAGHAGTEAGAGVQQNLQVVKESMVAAETAVMQHRREAAKPGGEYVRDNVWNWY